MVQQVGSELSILVGDRIVIKYGNWDGRVPSSFLISAPRVGEASNRVVKPIAASLKCFVVIMPGFLLGYPKPTASRSGKSLPRTAPRGG
jgi:hypothetical protein